ncbi:uncharacterized protein F4812DRAFT_453164 [Daldinia caldariorum]|uniref:uncharacterized protein n=1 Tax=Daldinia caldariorum TaxID=326644 RepID=UPI0020072956|nr:uncharacterized protein F4812DRAFT_453164 [Daldinia caldariorum]KAI1464045.1 hypothetical protein F4812DRAFT_453164 [Daldinia caldariorum]
MEYTRDVDGFTVPPIPVSTGSRPQENIDFASVAPSDATRFTRSSSRASGRSLVENPRYRDMSLFINHIYMRSFREEFPKHIVDLINRLRRDRDSPGPSQDQLWQDTTLEELVMGVAEPEPLNRANRQPMVRHAVPNVGSNLKVSTPVPNMLYGYNRSQAFPQQEAQLISMGTEMIANNQPEGLLYPFFAIEFEGDSGSMWVATNQCLGASASCVKIAESLNNRLRNFQSDEIQLIDSAAFSMATNGSEARLYISWKQNEVDYYIFLLQDPGHYLELRKYVRNIIYWGKGDRLNGIRKSLDALLSGMKCKPSTRRSRSKSNLMQGQSDEAEEYWGWDDTYER